MVVEWDFEGLVEMETIFEGKPPLLEDVKCRGFAEKTKNKVREKENEEDGGNGSGPRPSHFLVDWGLNKRIDESG